MHDEWRVVTASTTSDTTRFWQLVHPCDVRCRFGNCTSIFDAEACIKAAPLIIDATASTTAVPAVSYAMLQCFVAVVIGAYRRDTISLTFLLCNNVFQFIVM